MYPEINKQSEVKIKSLLVRILRGVVVINNLPKINPNYNLFEDLSRELNKRKTNFKVDKYQVIDIFIDSFIFNMDFFVQDSEMRKVETNFVEMDDVSDMVQRIFDYFKSTPRYYTVTLTLEKMKIPSVSVKGEVSICSPIQEKRFSSLAGNLFIKPLQIITTVKGYYSRYSEAYFIKDVLQNINVLIFFLLTKAVVIRNVRWDHTSGYKSIYFGKNQEVPVIEAIIESDDYPIISELSNIPLPISKYLSELEFNPNKEFSTIKSQIEDCVAISDVIITDPSRGVGRIRSAIGWYISSQTTDDSTMSFLQICMGLESIFGDDGDSDGGLTKMLANRCSYLIGRNLNERDFIRLRFREIYRVRSIIVHGVRSDLSYDEIDIKNDASRYLIDSINKEVTNIVI